MAEVSSEIAPPPSTDRFRWSIVTYTAATAIIPFALIQFSKSWDFFEVLYLILIVPVVLLLVIVTAVIAAMRRGPRASMSFFAAIIPFCLVTWLLFVNSTELHGAMLWALHSRTYKAEVLAQSASDDGGLKHIEWYGWGLAGSDTSAYLAYDPSNSLAHRDPATGRFGVLRCDEVWRVRRLEDHWYSVTFDTNEVWDTSCDTDAPSP